MEKIKELLKDLDLDKKEIDIYLTSIKIWTSPSSAISKITQIPKSTVRYSLESLTNKWLMNKSQKWNTTLFTPEHPIKLKNLLSIKKNKLENTKNKLDNIMWELTELYNPYTKLPKVTFYEWIDSVIKMLIDNHAKIKDNTYEFSAQSDLLKKYPREIQKYSDLHMKYRKNHKNYVIDSIEYKDENDKLKKNYGNIPIKYYPDKNLNLKTHIQVDWDKIAIISNHWDEPLWIDIHHKEIAEDFKKIFKQIWKLLDKEK